MEEAAIGGHRDARFNLGNHEGIRGNYVKAMKHKLIAAKLGDDNALEQMKKLMETGLLVSKEDFKELMEQGLIVSKEDYEAALRGHKAALDATKSEQRDAAEKYYRFLLHDK